ncbi:peptidoglycan-binding protein [Patescibacteria group bacterium]
MFKKRTFNLIFFTATFFLFFPFLASAVSMGEKINFFVDSSYDLQERQEVTASLEKLSNKLYFYIDDNWLSDQNPQARAQIAEILNNLTIEFESRIYPIITSNFGTERKPGIDNDERITVLLHQMKEDVGGYFNSADEYPKIQIPRSNEREMIYLNTTLIDNPNAKSALAHEFMHLVTFNQKEFLHNVTEETWLNEMYSEFTSTLLGYDNIYSGSTLQKRVKVFLEKPSDSLTEWLGENYDYGVVNLFMQYLVDHYGLKILVDSMHSLKISIPSIDESLKKNGFSEHFNQIFTNWTIAVLVNDCSLGQRYCYLNSNLSNLRITPVLNFLPLSGDSSLSITHRTTNWAGNWQKITGGKGSLDFEFDGTDNIIFKVPYLLCDYLGKCSVEFFQLDTDQKGSVNVEEFSQEYASLILIPSIQNKIVGFDGVEPFYIFTWRASIQSQGGENDNEEELRIKLLAQIDFLQKQIVQLQTQINAILLGGGQTIACNQIKSELYFGMDNNQEVRCLQEFLKSQKNGIYPEELVTGNFYSLTQAAVIRFQEKYTSEILFPLNLQQGTGYVGQATLVKINQLLQI